MPRRYVYQVSEKRTASVFMVEMILTHYLTSFCIRDRLVHECLVKEGNEFRLAHILFIRFFGIVGEKSRVPCSLYHPENSVQA
jgi:hypothetical protein